MCISQLHYFLNLAARQRLGTWYPDQRPSSLTRASCGADEIRIHNARSTDSLEFQGALQYWVAENRVRQPHGDGDERMLFGLL